MYTQQTHYFLGANTPNGYYSMYDELIDLGTAEALYIIKGGPGSGKSRIIESIAKEMLEAGLEVEFIHSLADPDSLDAIQIPALKTAYVDGTSPHIIDAKYPGITEQYINTCSFYNIERLKEEKEEVIGLSFAYKRLYDRAYDCLASAMSILHDIGSYAEKAISSIHKRAAGIISREIPKVGNGEGKVTRRFITAVTSQGIVSRFDTVNALAKRVYMMDNNLGLAGVMLDDIIKAAKAAKWDIIVCPSPFQPNEIDHIIIPALSLAFVSSVNNLEYTGEYYRHIRLDAMANDDKQKSYKAKIRFSKKIALILLEEAVSALSDAEKIQASIEALYKPCVDTAKIDAVAEAHVKMLLDKLD